jgi:polysaccharide export outer membrane protein
MKRLEQLIFLAVLLAGFASCKTQNLLAEKKEDAKFQHIQTDSAFLYNSNYEYRVRKDDKISVSFWNHDDLSVGSIYGIYNSNEVYGKWLLVDAKGNITLPRIGNFKIEGMTVIEAENILTGYYKKWIVDPVIEVKVLNKEITIIGELKNPGKYVVEKDNNTLLDVVSMAGGYDFYANLKSIKIIRQQQDSVKMMNVDLTDASDYLKRNIQIFPGDLVVVPSKKYKEFDKRIATIIPLASTTTAVAILLGAL